MDSKQVIWQPGITLEQMEKDVILEAFRHFHGNKTQTSNSLGIAVRTLDNKLKEYQDAKERNGKRIEFNRYDFTDGGRRNSDGRLKSREHLLREQRHDLVAEYDARIKSEEAKKHGVPVKAGNDVESSDEVPSKQSVSMPERKEVQELPPQKYANGNPNQVKQIRK